MRLEALEERVQLLFLQLDLLRELVELRHVDAAVLVPVLEEDGDRVDGHRPPLPRSPRL